MAPDLSLELATLFVRRYLDSWNPVLMEQFVVFSLEVIFWFSLYLYIQLELHLRWKIIVKKLAKANGQPTCNHVISQNSSLKQVKTKILKIIIEALLAVDSAVCSVISLVLAIKRRNIEKVTWLSYHWWLHWKSCTMVHLSICSEQR